MDTSETKEIFLIERKLKKAEHINCDNCFDPVVFMLKDKEHEFSIGLENNTKMFVFLQLKMVICLSCHQAG